MTSQPNTTEWAIEASLTGFQIAHARKYHLGSETGEEDKDAETTEADNADAMPKSVEAIEDATDLETTTEPGNSDAMPESVETMKNESREDVTELVETPADPLVPVGTVALAALVVVPITLWMLKR